MSEDLSHLDDAGRPRMVDVSAKDITTRTATAEALVRFPEAAWQVLTAANISTRKGSVLDVARIAGTMGVKQTASLIPFCHPLPLDSCTFELDPDSANRSIRIRCSVKCTARTGVEMEALTGVTVAALAVYDMTKSLGHGIEIEHVRLLSKTGGKQDYADNG